MADNIVRGKVLMHETRTGIRDLVVAVYEYDWPEHEQFYDILAGKSTSPEFDPFGSDMHGFNVNVDSDSDSDEIKWPQSLGSVLTDENGLFELTFDNELVKERDGSRPDLLLMVLAPDFPEDINTSSLGLNLPVRLLHTSRIPWRQDAGPIESFMILLRQGWLEKKQARQISHEFDSKEASKIYADLLLSKFRENKNYKSAQKSALNNYFTENKETLALAQRRTKHFIQSVATGGNQWRDNFVATVFNPTNPIDFSTYFYADLPDATIQLNLTDQDIVKLDATVGATGQGPSLCKLMEYFGFGTSLERTRNLTTDIELRERLNALYLSGLDIKLDATDENIPETIETNALVVRSQIIDGVKFQIEALIKEIDADDTSSDNSENNDLLRLKKQIEELNELDRKSDVVASHEFSVLNLAFDSTWRAAFDPAFENAVEELFSLVVDVVGKEVGSAFDATVFSPEKDLYDVLRQVQAITTAIESANEASDAPRTAVVDLGFGQVHIPVPPSTPRETFPVVPAIPVNRRLKNLAESVRDMLDERYSFRYFQPNSVNYGILVTHGQEWTPMGDQLGQKIKNFHLTPGEVVEITETQKWNTTNNEKSIQKNLTENTSENQSVGRTELEAIAKTAQALDIKAGAEAGINVGILSVSGSASITDSNSSESQRVQKKFAETTKKAAEQVLKEVEISYETVDKFDRETGKTRTLTNSNNEKSVTYSFYEVRRKFRVASRVQRVQPVIAVALEMPAPHEVTDAWVLRHAWIIKRALLDAGFEDAIEFIENGLSGMLMELEIAKSMLSQQSSLFVGLSQSGQRLAAQMNRVRAEISTLHEQKLAAERDEDNDGAVEDFVEFFGGSSDDGHIKTFEEKMAAAAAGLEILKSEFDSNALELVAGEKGLNEASLRLQRLYMKKSKRDTAVAQLLLHLKDNIYHYMHQIWAKDHPDERFFSLYDIPVPFFESDSSNYTLRPATPADSFEDDVPGIPVEGERYVLEFHAPKIELEDPTQPLSETNQPKIPKRKLVEIADIDNPIGFKGNYILFALKSCSHVTDYMMHEYFNQPFGVQNPGGGAYTAKDLIAFLERGWNADVLQPGVDEQGRPNSVPYLSDEQKQQLVEKIENMMRRNPGIDIDVLLPASGLTHMEVETSKKSLLDDFKIEHRLKDLSKVEEEVRRARLENLRFASRLVQDEPVLDDPDVDKNVRVTGEKSVVISDE